MPRNLQGSPCSPDEMNGNRSEYSLSLVVTVELNRVDIEEMILVVFLLSIQIQIQITQFYGVYTFFTCN